MPLSLIGSSLPTNLHTTLPTSPAPRHVLWQDLYKPLHWVNRCIRSSTTTNNLQTPVTLAPAPNLCRPPLRTLPPTTSPSTGSLHIAIHYSHVSEVFICFSRLGICWGKWSASLWPSGSSSLGHLLARRLREQPLHLSTTVTPLPRSFPPPLPDCGRGRSYYVGVVG